MAKLISMLGPRDKWGVTLTPPGALVERRYGEVILRMRITGTWTELSTRDGDYGEFETTCRMSGIGMRMLALGTKNLNTEILSYGRPSDPMPKDDWQPPRNAAGRALIVPTDIWSRSFQAGDLVRTKNGQLLRVLTHFAPDAPPLVMDCHGTKRAMPQRRTWMEWVILARGEITDPAPSSVTFVRNEDGSPRLEEPCAPGSDTAPTEPPPPPGPVARPRTGPPPPGAVYERFHDEIVGFVKEHAPGVKVVTDAIERGFMIWFAFGHGVTLEYYVPTDGQWRQEEILCVLAAGLQRIGRKVVCGD